MSKTHNTVVTSHSLQLSETGALENFFSTEIDEQGIHSNERPQQIYCKKLVNHTSTIIKNTNTQVFVVSCKRKTKALHVNWAVIHILI